MAISMAGFSFPHGYNLVPTQNTVVTLLDMKVENQYLWKGCLLVMITINNYSYHHQAGPVDFETLVRNLARVRGSKLLALLLQQVPGEREATEQLS